jgi:hypothetical protein
LGEGVGMLRPAVRGRGGLIMHTNVPRRDYMVEGREGHVISQRTQMVAN